MLLVLAFLFGILSLPPLFFLTTNTKFLYCQCNCKPTGRQVEGIDSKCAFQKKRFEEERERDKRTRRYLKQEAMSRKVSFAFCMYVGTCRLHLCFHLDRALLLALALASSLSLFSLSLYPQDYTHAFIHTHTHTHTNAVTITRLLTYTLTCTDAHTPFSTHMHPHTHTHAHSTHTHTFNTHAHTGLEYNFPDRRLLARLLSKACI